MKNNPVILTDPNGMGQKIGGKFKADIDFTCCGAAERAIIAKAVYDAAVCIEKAGYALVILLCELILAASWRAG